MAKPHSTLPKQEGFDVHFSDSEFAVEWAIAYLRDNEYAVSPAPDGRHWETPKELHARIAPTMVRVTFHRRLNHPGCPAFKGKYGAKRLIRLKATHALEAWLTRPLKASGHRKKEVFA